VRFLIRLFSTAWYASFSSMSAKISCFRFILSCSFAFSLGYFIKTAVKFSAALFELDLFLLKSSFTRGYCLFAD
jgi:hypothetical protein